MEQETKEEKAKGKAKVKLNPWMISTAVFAVLFVISILFGGGTGFTGSMISSQEAGSRTLELINEYFVSEGSSAVLVSTEEESGLYKVGLVYIGKETSVYMTKDGSYLVMPSGIVNVATLKTASQSSGSQMQKSDKPVVELFVMTHCPYGTQAEKGLIPVIETLGASIDAKIRFVHYFIHGDEEEQETYRQVCIREEYPDKYLDYLKCFLEAGEGEDCLSNLEIDKAELDSCIKDRSKDYYDEDSFLSEQYGVNGSPTLVINGVIVSSGRSPSAYLSTICSAFNEEPELCEEILSSETPSAGFGYGGGSSTETGSC